MRSSCWPALLPVTDQVWRFVDDEAAVMACESPEGFGAAFLANSTRCKGGERQHSNPTKDDDEREREREELT